MPTATVRGPVTLQDAAAALRDNLGAGYEVTMHGNGSHERLKVKHSAASTATVRLDRQDNSAMFHVHGGGLAISRLANEFGIAKKVAAVIAESFGTRS